MSNFDPLSNVNLSAKLPDDISATPAKAPFQETEEQPSSNRGSLNLDDFEKVETADQIPHMEPFGKESGDSKDDEKSPGTEMDFEQLKDEVANLISPPSKKQDEEEDLLSSEAVGQNKYIDLLANLDDDTDQLGVGKHDFMGSDDSLRMNVGEPHPGKEEPFEVEAPMLQGQSELQTQDEDDRSSSPEMKDSLVKDLPKEIVPPPQEELQLFREPTPPLRERSPSPKRERSPTPKRKSPSPTPSPREPTPPPSPKEPTPPPSPKEPTPPPKAPTPPREPTPPPREPTPPPKEPTPPPRESTPPPREPTPPPREPTPPPREPTPPPRQPTPPPREPTPPPRQPTPPPREPTPPPREPTPPPRQPTPPPREPTPPPREPTPPPRQPTPPPREPTPPPREPTPPPRQPTPPPREPTPPPKIVPQMQSEFKAAVQEPIISASKPSYSYNSKAPSESFAKAFAVFKPLVNLIYWRDLKKSGITFGSLMMILLSLAYISLISVVAYSSLLVLTATIAFRIYKNVMQAVQKSQDGHPFKSYLELDTSVPPEKMHEAADVFVSQLNSAMNELKRLFLVEDLIDSVKFGCLLWCLTYVGSWFNGLTLVILMVVALFSLPKVYEQNQAQIDQYVGLVRTQVNDVMTKVKAAIPIGNKEKAQ